MKIFDYIACKPWIHALEGLIQYLWQSPPDVSLEFERWRKENVGIGIAKPNLTRINHIKCFYYLHYLLYHSKHHISSFNLKSDKAKSSEVTQKRLLNFLLLMRPTDGTPAQHPFLWVLKRQKVERKSRIE